VCGLILMAPKKLFRACWGGTGILRSSGEKTGCLVVVDDKVSRSIAITTFGAPCLASGGVSTISKNTDSNYLVH
jgi:hypothetical protein